MHQLRRHFDGLVDRYHGPEGDAFAIEELAPVARRFLPEGGRALEIGCGYGRNLAALSTLPGARVTGCDVDMGELRRARAKIDGLPEEAKHRVGIAQQEPLRLPFRDGTFDFVVLWQVLEHVFGVETKRGVLHEAVRVLKPGGHVLIETPNQWFPIDYHDNKVPLAHWLLPTEGRRWLTWRVRGKRYQPSEYLSLPGYAALLRSAPGVTAVRKATRVYFAESYAQAWRELGGTQVPLKRAIFAALAPVHAALSPFGGSADLFLPSLRLVFQVDKTAGRD